MMIAVQTCVLSILLCGQTQPPALPDPAPVSREAILEDFRRDAEKYSMTLKTHPPALLKLHEKPVLNWTNPAGSNEDGVVYLWMKDGRPEVAGSVWTYIDPRTKRVLRKHAFHSLADAAI